MSQHCLGQTLKGQPCRSTIGLKNGFCSLHGQAGEGIVQDVKDFIHKRVKAVRDGPSKKAPDRITKFLEKQQGKQVVSIKVGRKPIINPVERALNTLSLGAYKRKKKALDYDSVYHNYLLVKLSDGKTYKLEKNHRVEWFPARESDEKNETFDVPLNGKQLTLPEMFDNASKGQEEAFWHYRGGGQNCQIYTRDMVERNGLLPSETLPIQDSKALLSTLPGKELIPNLVTDTANVLDRMRHGDGINTRKKIPCPL